MNNKGWIKLHRKILDDEELMRSPSAFKLFIILLLSCDRDGKWSGGRFQLARLSGLKESNTYKPLKRLEKLKMVTLRSNSKFTTILICNWKKYQTNGNTSEEQQRNNRGTTEQHSYKNKNNKNKEYNGFNKFPVSEKTASIPSIGELMKEKGMIK